MPARLEYATPEINPWSLRAQNAPVMVIDNIVVGDGSDGYNVTVNYSLLTHIAYSLTTPSPTPEIINTALNNNNFTPISSVSTRRYLNAVCYILPDENPDDNFGLYTRWPIGTSGQAGGVLKRTNQSDNIITDFLINPLEIKVPLVSSAPNIFLGFSDPSGSVLNDANPEKFKVVSRDTVQNQITIKYDNFDAFASRKNNYFKDSKPFSALLGNKKNSELEVYQTDPTEKTLAASLTFKSATYERKNLGSDFFLFVQGSSTSSTIEMFRTVRIKSSFTAKNIKFNKGFTVLVVPALNYSLMKADGVNLSTFDIGRGSTQKQPLGIFLYVPDESIPSISIQSSVNAFITYPNNALLAGQTDQQKLQYFTNNPPKIFLHRDADGLTKGSSVQVVGGSSTLTSVSSNTAEKTGVNSVITNGTYYIPEGGYSYYNSDTSNSDQSARISNISYFPNILKQYLIDRVPKTSQIKTFITANQTAQVKFLNKNPAFFSPMFSSFSVNTNNTANNSPLAKDIIRLRQEVFNQRSDIGEIKKAYSRLTNFIFLDLFESYKALSPFSKIFTKSFITNFFESVYSQSGANSVTFARGYFETCIQNSIVKVQSFSSRDGVNKKQINKNIVLSNFKNLIYTIRTTNQQTVFDDVDTTAVGIINGVDAYNRLTPVKLFSFLSTREITSLEAAIPGAGAGAATNIFGAQAYLGFVDGNLPLYETGDYVDYDIEIKIKDPFQLYIKEILAKAITDINYLERKANLLSNRYGNYYDFQNDKLNPEFYGKFHDLTTEELSQGLTESSIPETIAKNYCSLELPFLETPPNEQEKQEKISLIKGYLAEKTLTIGSFNLILNSYKQKYSNLLEKSKTNDDYLTISKKTSKQYKTSNDRLYLSKKISTSAIQNSKDKQIQFSDAVVFSSTAEARISPFGESVITRNVSGGSFINMASLGDYRVFVAIMFDEFYKKYFKKEWRRSQFSYTNSVPQYSQNLSQLNSNAILDKGFQVNLDKKMLSLIENLVFSLSIKNFNKVKPNGNITNPKDYGKFVFPSTNASANNDDLYRQFENDFLIKKNNIRDPFSQVAQIFEKSTQSTDTNSVINSLIANQLAIKNIIATANNSTSSNSSILFANYISLFVFHLMIANMIKIEYLAGFNTSISEPIWKSFFFDGETPAGKYLVRTRLINATSAGFPKDEAYNFPLYEEYQLVTKA